MKASNGWSCCWQGRQKNAVQSPSPPSGSRCRARALQVASYWPGTFMIRPKPPGWPSESRELYQSLGADGRVGYARACFVYDDPSRIAPRRKRSWRLWRFSVKRETGFGQASCLVRLGFMAASSHRIRKGESILGGMAGIVQGDRRSGWHCRRAILLRWCRFRPGQAGTGRVPCMRKPWEYSPRSTMKPTKAILISSWQRCDTIEGNYVQAAAHATQALSIGHRQGRWPDHPHWADHTRQAGAPAGKHLWKRREWFEEDLAYFRKKDHKAHMAGALYFLGLLAWTTGDVEQAGRRYTEVLNTYGGFDSVLKAWALSELGKVALAHGEMDQARSNFEQALDMSITIITPEHNNITHPMDCPGSHGSSRRGARAG